MNLSLDDIRITEIDRRTLLSDMASVLDLSAKDGHRETSRILHLGDYAIAAGLRFPVFACLETGHQPISPTEITALERRALPYVLLVSSLATIAVDALAIATGQRGRALAFEECLQFAEPPGAGLAPSMPAASLFAPEIAALTAGRQTEIKAVMELPAEADWPNLRFTFTADEVLNVRYGNQSPKRIEPDHLGMEDARTGKVARQWRLLQLCAALEGALPRSFPVQTIRGQRASIRMIGLLAEFERGYDRQRQFLATTLKKRFGIDRDPFSVADDCYDARFVVDASGLKQGRADQRDRNFGGDD